MEALLRDRAEAEGQARRIRWEVRVPFFRQAPLQTSAITASSKQE
jgi:hypothetical protein